MNRYFSSFMLTLGLYLSLFVVIFFSWDQKVEFTDKTKEAKSIQVSLVSLPTPPKPAPITPPIEEPQPKEEPKKVEKIEPKVKEVAQKPLPKIEPKAKKILKKKPIQKKPVEKIVQKIQKKKPINKVAKKQRKSNPQNGQKSIITKKSKNSSKKLAQKRNLYFAQLTKKIKQNKSYPHIAKRRGMQGSVKVSFMLSPSGQLLSIKILSGPKIFHEASKSAIKRSLPYAPPKGVSIENQPFTISLDYKLI